MNSDFKREYQCEVPKVSGDVKIYDEYYKMTEEFDKDVCTGQVINGGRLPANGEESRRINRNARSVRDDLMHKYEISAGRFQEIIKEFGNRRR